MVKLKLIYKKELQNIEENEIIPDGDVRSIHQGWIYVFKSFEDTTNAFKLISFKKDKNG